MLKYIKVVEFKPSKISAVWVPLSTDSTDQSAAQKTALQVFYSLIIK